MSVMRTAALRRPIPDVCSSAAAAPRGGGDAVSLVKARHWPEAGEPAVSCSCVCGADATVPLESGGVCPDGRRSPSESAGLTAKQCACSGMAAAAHGGELRAASVRRNSVGVEVATSVPASACATRSASTYARQSAGDDAVTGNGDGDVGDRSGRAQPGAALRGVSMNAAGSTVPEASQAAADRTPSRGGGRVLSGRGGGNDGLRHAREVDVERLVENAIAAIRVAGERPLDAVFGPFAEINSLVRAVTYHEGWLLEQGMARRAAENPSLLIMPAETALPIVPAALEMLERNDWKSLRGIRLRSEVQYRTTYVPDLFIVNPEAHWALIVDMKRSLASYQERHLKALRTRMMAAALIAADWLHVEGRVGGVTEVEVAIVDGSSERRDRENGIFALDEIGELIEVEDAGAAMLQLRAKYACRVQEEIHAACLRAVVREPEEADVEDEEGVGETRSEDGADSVDPAAEADPASSDAEEAGEVAHETRGGSPMRAAAGLEAMELIPQLSSTVRFARGRLH